MSVAAKEWLHRSRANWAPDFLLRLRQEAKEEEQDVSGVQDADPVGRLHLPQLRRRVHTRGTPTRDLTGGFFHLHFCSKRR